MRFHFQLASVAFYCLLVLSGCGEMGMEGEEGRPSFLISTLYFMFLAFFVYYMIVIKPGQVEAEEQRKAVEGFTKGTPVVTSGGIIGTFQSKKGDVVMIEVAPKVSISVLATEVSAKKGASAQTNKK